MGDRAQRTRPEHSNKFVSVFFFPIFSLIFSLENKRKMKIIQQNPISDDLKVKHYLMIQLMMHQVYYIDQKLKKQNKHMKSYLVLFKKQLAIKHEVYYVVQLMKF
jgi:hypothetical protein